MTDVNQNLQAMTNEVALSYNDLLNQIVEITYCTRRQAASCIALVSRWLSEDEDV